jgi:hypothetical protein
MKDGIANPDRPMGMFPVGITLPVIHIENPMKTM